MYLLFGTDVADPDFSFLIAKNPASPPFVRPLGKDGSRTVTGRYVGHDYEIIVANDESALAEKLREANQPHYVTGKPFSVLPFNLVGVGMALSSALAGKAELPPEQIAMPRAMHATVGPFLNPWNDVCQAFKALGFEVDHEGRMVTLALTASVAEFLQRLYVGAFFLGVAYHDAWYAPDGQVVSVLKAAETWIDSCPMKAAIVRRLTVKRPELRAEYWETRESRTLHQQRHEAILANLPETASTVVDLGCNEGALTELLVARYPDARVIAMDANDHALGRMYKRFQRGHHVKTVHANIAVPELEVSDLRPDVMVCSEVIEHLTTQDRALLIQQIAKCWQPATLVLTAPCIEYNAVLGMSEGVLRHGDHKIEYTRAEWKKQTDPLREVYDLVEVPLVDGEIQPSFVTVGKRRECTPDLRLVVKAREAHTPFTLDETGYVVSRDELLAGLTHPTYNDHRASLFFMAPTMAPVDYCAEHPDYLEHPEAAFRYYRERGVTQLVEQEKLMGSRCSLLLFRDEEKAAKVGCPPVVALSREGRPFFNAEMLAKLHADAAPAFTRTDADVLIVDAEVTPWGYKSGGKRDWIERQFRGPLECQHAYKKLTGADTADVEKALDVLGWFTRDEPVTVNLFALLATAKIGKRGFEGVRFQSEPCYYGVHRLFDDTSFAAVRSEIINLNVDRQRDESINRWLDYTTHGEGFVYKPAHEAILPDGCPVQPALKVRGREYLRLTYGADYLGERFKKLTHRGTSLKRRLALQEHVLSRRILTSFLRGNHVARERYIAAFLGVDGIVGGKVDRTL